MSDTDRVAAALESLGFTEYESRAYLSAVSLGTARFSELATESDVPQQRIYDVVDGLRERGLVEVHERTGGNEVVALPPDVALEDLKQRRVEMLSRSVNDAVEELQRQFTSAEPSEGFVTIVDHDDSARRHMRNAIDAAEWWLTASVPAALYESLQPDIEAAVDRNVTVQLLIQDEEADLAELTFDDRIDVRHRPSADRLIAADRAYAVYQGIASPVVSRPYLITRNENLVVMLQRYRDEFWHGSRWIQHGTSARRRYLIARDVVNAIQEELDAGEHVEVYIEGIDTETGQERSWEGRIVDYELSVAEDADLSVVLPYLSTLRVDTGDETLSVGGWDATVEDIAAYGIELRR